METHIIMDMSILWHDPEVLEAEQLGFKIFIPEGVMTEITRSNDGARAKILNQLIQAYQGRIRILTSSMRSKITDSTGRRLWGEDDDIASIAIRHAKQHPDAVVMVASEDKALHNYSSQFDFEVIDSKGLKLLIQRERLKTKNRAKTNYPPEVVKLQKRYSRYKVFAAIIAGLACLGFGFVSREFFEIIQRQDSGVIIRNTVATAGLIGGPILFFVRCRWLKLYAFAEIIFGYFAVVYALSAHELTIPGGTQLIGGLYIIVRGMDNLGKSLKTGFVANLWRRVFEGAPEMGADRKMPVSSVDDAGLR